MPVYYRYAEKKPKFGLEEDYMDMDMEVCL
jgi:hypothetical protein